MQPLETHITLCFLEVLTQRKEINRKKSDLAVILPQISYLQFQILMFSLKTSFVDTSFHPNSSCVKITSELTEQETKTTAVHISVGKERLRDVGLGMLQSPPLPMLF